MKCLLLDLDGTVTNSLKLINRTYRKLFEHMDIPWEDDAVMQYIGIPLRDIGRIFAGEERVDYFFKTYQELYKIEHDLFMECYPGAVETINYAKKKGYKIGIVTSKSHKGTMLSLDFLKITTLMDVVITADDVEKHKPDPSPVLAALQSLGAIASEAVFVGDSPFDIEAGKAAGVTTIGVTWGMAAPALIEQYSPDYILHSWEEMKLLLMDDAFFR